ncbi:MAG: Crp/Fnr family transcriptional regulator [Bacteroidales bacterium]
MVTAASRNRIVRALEPDELDRLQPHFEVVEMRQGETLARKGDAPTHLYFPETAVVSMVAATAGRVTVEVAFVGCESVAGALALLGEASLPYDMIVNLPGAGVRVPVQAAREAVTPHGQLRPLTERALRLLVVQVTQAAVCNRFHSPRQRLARWLALASERVSSGVFPMTHEVMASMVGGARSMVTQACNELRDMGAVEYRRGALRVLDADRLRAEACECYGVVTAAVNEMMAE